MPLDQHRGHDDRNAADFILTGFVDGELRVWKIPEGETRVGRGSGVEISIRDKSVSHQHAVLRRSGNDVSIEDLDSLNGTKVNAGAVRQARQLRPEDRIAFGQVILRFAAQVQSEQLALTEHGKLTYRSLQWQDLRQPGDHGKPESMLETLSEMGDFLARRHPEGVVLELGLEWVERIIPCQRACVLLLNADGAPELRSVRVRGGNPRFKSLALSRTMIETVIRDRAVLLTSDAQLDPRFAQKDSIKAAQIRSALVAPLFDNTHVIGVLYVDDSVDADVYDSDHLRRLAFLANILAIKISNARLVEVERKQERLRQELEAAEHIQRAFLRKPVAPEGYEIVARLAPSTEVGGDLYDTIRLRDGRTLVAVADVSGHGVGSALIMASAIATIRALAELADDPVDLVTRVHKQMYGSIDPGSYLTMFLGIIDPGAERLTYVNAGHDYPVLIRPRQASLRLESTGVPIGMIPGAIFEAAVVEFPPGALLAVWTDGIPEAYRLDANGSDAVDCFGDHEPMGALLARLQDRSLDDIVDEVFSSLDRFLGGQRAPDDATLLLVRRTL